MLQKSNSGDMSFKKVIKIKILVSVFIILVGLKCLLLVFLNQIGDLQSLTSKFGIDLVNFNFMQGFYTWFGCVLIVAGVAIIAGNAVLLKEPEKFKKAEIDYFDERNQLIRIITVNTTSCIFIVALTFAIVISGMFNSIVFVALLGAFFVYLLILFSSYMIIRTKY
jgi:hypothetical protein